MLSSTKQGSYSAPVKAEIRIIHFMDQNIGVFMHFLKGIHCNLPFFQQVKNMLKIKLQDALVFSVGFLWLWNPEGQRQQHNLPE